MGGGAGGELGLNQLKVQYSVFHPRFWATDMSLHIVHHKGLSPCTSYMFFCLMAELMGSSVPRGLGVPDGNHLPPTGLHFSKAKYVKKII